VFSATRWEAECRQLWRLRALSQPPNPGGQLLLNLVEFGAAALDLLLVGQRGTWVTTAEAISMRARLLLEDVITLAAVDVLRSVSSGLVVVRGSVASNHGGKYRGISRSRRTASSSG
jgi:hypothetical protein